MGGGLQSHHGANEAILAMSKIKNRYPDVTYKIIGNILVDINPAIKIRFRK